MSRFGTVMTLGAAVAIALGVAACSGSGSDGSTPAPTPLSTHRGDQVDASDVAQQVRAALSAAGSAAYTLSSSTSSGDDAKGALNFAKGGTSVSLDLVDASDTLSVVSVPGALYANVGRPVGGKHWLKVTAAGTDTTSTTLAPLLSYLTSTADISAQTASWDQANLFLVGGRRTISGQPTTEYDATIPQDAVKAGLPEQFRSLMQATVTGDTDLRLWLDAQARPVRMTTVSSLDDTKSTVTVTYSSWGTAPKVTLPPASDVTTAPAG